MSEQQTPNQANQVRVSDALVAAGKLVPFEQLEWTDFPLETRLRALRALLDALARLKEKRRRDAANKNEEPRAPTPTAEKGSNE